MRKFKFYIISKLFEMKFSKMIIEKAREAVIMSIDYTIYVFRRDVTFVFC